MNRSTFYLHYADQYSLLEDVENDVIVNTIKSLEEEDSISDTEFNIYMDTLFDYLKDNKNFVKVLFNNPDAHAFEDLFIDTTMAKIKETEGSGPPKKNGKYIYAYVAQGCYNLVKEWINADFDIPSNEISKLILKLYQSSIRIENI